MSGHTQDTATAIRAGELHPLTRDFLLWLTTATRAYADVMAAWRSSCPRYTIWEDALADGLVRVEHANGATFTSARVVLTERGQALLTIADLTPQPPLRNGEGEYGGGAGSAGARDTGRMRTGEAPK